MKTPFGVALGIALLAVASVATAGLYDFEDGGDGLVVSSPDPTMVFVQTGGADWIYGDWRTGDYWGPYPDGPYYSFGNFFAWLSPDQFKGRINFPQGTTYFSVRYSSADEISIKAYNSLGVVVDQATGAESLDIADMGTLIVEADAIAFVEIIGAFPGFGNYWLIDNAATEGCEVDSDCDDGVFCNGAEVCGDNGVCEPGDTFNLCPDDGLYCNGTEFCDTESDACASQNAPVCEDDGLYCNGVELCDELAEACIHEDEPDCSSDGQFCNGEEFCDEDANECSNTGNPCEDYEECNEETDLCETDDLTPPPGDEVEEIIDETIRGGGCG